ncbi:MAG: ABC transporter substrate-binding protein [Desulfomonilaceae bacterium]
MGKNIVLFLLVFVSCLAVSATSADQAETINIAVEFNDHAASAYVARHKGWFRDADLDVRFYNYVTGMALAAALGRGQIHAAYMCLLPAINAKANAGTPIRIVAGTHQYGYGLAVNEAKVKGIKDLEREDVRIGCVQVGSPSDAFLLRIIELYGLEPSRVLKKVQRMAPPMQIAAIKAGMLDAIILPEHWPAIAEQAGFKTLLTAEDVWPGMQGSVLAVMDQLIKTRPDAVRKLVAITFRATRWIEENPHQAAELMAAELQVAGENFFPVELAKPVSQLLVTPETMLRSMERLKYTNGVELAAVQEQIDFARRHGYIRQPLNASDMVDLSFLHEAPR